MSARTADQIRFLMTITAIISVATVIGVAPTLWAAL
jgi:hypothetical protein